MTESFVYVYHVKGKRDYHSGSLINENCYGKPCIRLQLYSGFIQQN